MLLDIDIVDQVRRPETTCQLELEKREEGEGLLVVCNVEFVVFGEDGAGFALRVDVFPCCCGRE